MREKKVIGYRKFKKKTGEPMCIVIVVMPCDDRDNQFGAFGSKIEEVFIPDSCHNLVTPQIIGKIADFTYDVVNKRAYVVSVNFK